MFDDILQALITLANTTGVTVKVGSMPPDNGYAMTGDGGALDIHFDNGTTGTMSIVLNGKNSNQQTVIDKLDAIHALLTRRQDYPAAGIWQIYNIRTVSSPRLIGREENSQWLYGSSLAVKFYEKGI